MIIEGFGLPNSDILYSYHSTKPQDLVGGIVVNQKTYKISDRDGLTFDVTTIPYGIIATAMFIVIMVLAGLFFSFIGSIIVAVFWWGSQREKMNLCLVYNDGTFIVGYTYNKVEQRKVKKWTRAALDLHNFDKPTKMTSLGVVQNDGSTKHNTNKS